MLQPTAPRWSPITIVAIWPFIFHYRLVLPIGGRFQRIGNDFDALYYAYKPYLLAGLADGHIPLWMPQEAGGFPFVLNPFAQALYPGNLVALPLARYLGYWGPLEHQRFTVLAVSLLALALYLILRKLTLGPLAAALAVLIVSSSYKVSETLRFPNATHAIAWACVALLAIVHLRVAQSTRRRLFFSLLLTVATICMATAGYPYYLFYFFLLLPPFLLWIEFGSPDGYRSGRVRSRTFLALVTGAIGIALIAVAPYLTGMQRLLEQTSDRGGGNWDYSTQHRFGIWEYAGSIVVPPTSSPEGWFYFGTAGVVVIGLAWLILWRERRLGQHARRIAMTCVWFAWIIFFGLGASNPVFRFVWETVPLVDTLRVWPRINIFLIFPLAILLGFSIQVIADHARDEAPHLSQAAAPMLLPAIVAALVLLLQLGLALTRPMSADFVQNMPKYYDAPTEREHILWTLLVVDLLALTSLSTRLFRASSVKRQRLLMASCVTFVAIWLVQIHGAQTTSWMWVLPDGFEENVDAERLPIGRTELMPTIARDALAATRLPPTDNPVFHPRHPWSTAVYANWHYRRYFQFLSDVSIDEATKSQLLGVTSSTRFFLIRSQVGSDPHRPGESDLLPLLEHDVVFYDGSRLVVDVNTDTAGELVFADNWDENWSATVAGHRSQVNLAFGTFKSVHIPEGRSRVVFSYCPFSQPVYRWLC